jgi:hypothetical protein
MISARSQPLVFQQFRDSCHAARLAAVLQLLGDPPRAVTPLVPPEHLAHQRHQRAIFPFALRLGFVPPGVKARPARAQDLAHRRHGKPSFQDNLINRRVHLRYPLRLKMANAFFNTSRSR